MAKALAVVDHVTRHPGISLSRLANDLGMPKGTAHRVVTELERLRYLERIPGRRFLTVGPRLAETALAAVRGRIGSLVPAAILRGLAEELGETCTIAVLDGSEVFYLNSAEPRQPLSLVFQPGSRAPLYCTSSGRIFMSFLEDQDLDRYLASVPRRAHTPHTTTRQEDLYAAIVAARDRGFAATHQEYVLHVVGAAVPIVAPGGGCIAALSFTAPDARVPFDAIECKLPALQRAAKSLSAALSHSSAGPRMDWARRNCESAPKRDSPR